MKAIQLWPYQIKATETIQGALDNGKEHIVVEMAIIILLLKREINIWKFLMLF